MVTTSELHDIAKEAVRIFARYGLACCLTGGVACELYGVSRDSHVCCNGFQLAVHRVDHRLLSQDVDLVVLTTKYSQEQLKDILITADSSFYLVPPKDPSATYKVLWYSIGPFYSRYASRCKVDILQPGIMNIPDLPVRYIETIRNLPVMPLTLLLFMKLQAWTDHRDSPKDYMRSKQYNDLSDISQLLDVALKRGERMSNGAKWMPEEFVRAALSRIEEHKAHLPSAAARWKAVG